MKTTTNDQPIGEIVEMTTEEVSLVDRAANRKTFLIVRADEQASAEASENQNEELLEQSQELGQETAGEDRLGGAGESLRSGEGTLGESGQVEDAAELARDIDEVVRESPEAPAVETVDHTEEPLTVLQRAVAELQAGQAAVKDALGLSAELAVVRAELAQSQAVTQECKNLLARVSKFLASRELAQADLQVTRAAPDVTPASNANNRVLESSLSTGPATGRLPIGQDLNRTFRPDKSK